MKNILQVLILTSLIALTFACTPDPCKDVTCNDGNCEEGICICDDGYGGEDCSQRLSQIFAGEWSGNFLCDDQTSDVVFILTDYSYDLRKISINTVGLKMSFDGLEFGLDDFPMQAQINEDFTAFVIDTQTYIINIPNNPGISADVFGNGTLLENNILSLTVNVENKNFGAFFSCTGEAIK